MRFTNVFSRLRSWLVLSLAAVWLLSACQPTPVIVPATETVPSIAESTLSPAALTQAPLTETPALTATPVPSALPPSGTPTQGPTAVVKPKSIKETENILVLGMDQRPGDLAWRTDTIIVVALDYEARQVGLISIPRDLWVEIPGYGMGRINQADMQGETDKYPGGGPALAGKVISDTFGIPTKHWVRLRLEALPDLVDALGGVTVTLNCPLHELTPDPAAPDSGRFEHFDLAAGEVFLNGKDAAKFARYRYASNDFSRAQRQQQLIWAIRKRALEVNILPKIPDFWKALSKTFKTDLSLLDIIRLARFGSELSPGQVHGMTFSKAAMGDAQVGPAWVVKIFDPTQVQKEIDGLFAARSIADQGREGSGGCPTPQPSPATPAVELTASPTPSAAPSNVEPVTATPIP